MGKVRAVGLLAVGAGGQGDGGGSPEDGGGGDELKDAVPCSLLIC